MGFWHRSSDPFLGNRTEWLIYPFFASGSVTLLNGQQKGAGKSTLIASVLATMLDKTGFYNRDTVYAPSLYFTEQTQQVFLETLEGAGALGLDEFFYTSATADLYAHDWPGRLDVLDRQMSRTGARYLVVDTFAPCACVAEDKENQGNWQVVADLQHLAVKHEAGVVVVQHTRKDISFWSNLIDVSRGHGSIAGAADSVGLLFNPDGDDTSCPHRWIKMAGRIGGIPEPFQVHYGPDKRYRFDKQIAREKKPVKTKLRFNNGGHD